RRRSQPRGGRGACAPPRGVLGGQARGAAHHLGRPVPSQAAHRMRNFTVTWDSKASLEVLAARVFLGSVRAAILDEELESIQQRPAALPESGHKVKVRGVWSARIRKVVLTCTPYRLFYDLDLAAKEIVIFRLQHQKQRPRAAR